METSSLKWGKRHHGGGYSLVGLGCEVAYETACIISFQMAWEVACGIVASVIFWSLVERVRWRETLFWTCIGLFVWDSRASSLELGELGWVESCPLIFVVVVFPDSSLETTHFLTSITSISLSLAHVCPLYTWPNIHSFLNHVNSECM